MNIVRRGIVALLLSALSVPGTVAAAQPPPTDLSVRIVDGDVSDYPDVALRVTVREANGVPVPGLEPFDFEVNEDRVPEARPLIAVEPVINPDLPVSIVLLIDISGSMAGQPLNDAKEAAQALIDQLGEGEQIAVIAFAGAIDLDTIDTAREHPPTTDRSAAATLIDGLEALGGTPLYDALYKGTLWAQEATPGHRAIVLLTDGVDEDPGSVVASVTARRAAVT